MEPVPGRRRPRRASGGKTDLDPGGETNRVETTTQLQIRAASCPGCLAEVRLVGRLLIGEVLDCAECGTQLEIASVEPPALERLRRIEDEDEDFEPGR